jgi:septal ring factor EnvC (AmiA/AmiB activator)
MREQERIDPKQLDDSIRSWMETKAKIAEMKKEMDKMSKDAADAESFIVQVMDQLEEEERRVDNITVKMKKQMQGGRPKYSPAFQFLYDKVNKQLKDMADEFLEGTKGDRWLKKWLVLESREERKALGESVVKRVISAIKDFIMSVKDKLKGVSSSIDALEKLDEEQTEATYRAFADALIEKAIN